MTTHRAPRDPRDSRLASVVVGIIVGSGPGLALIFSAQVFTGKPSVSPALSTYSPKYHPCIHDRWVMEEVRLLASSFHGRRPSRKAIVDAMGPGGSLRADYTKAVNRGMLPFGREQEITQLGDYYAAKKLRFGKPLLKQARKDLLSCP